MAHRGSAAGAKAVSGTCLAGRDYAQLRPAVARERGVNRQLACNQRVRIKKFRSRGLPFARLCHTFGDVADVKRDHRMSPSVGLALSFRLRAGHYSLSKHASSVVTSRCRSLVRPLVETSSPAAALWASA
jgi:hypothetical protein